MPNEMFEKGLKIRTEVLGEEYVNRAIKGANDFNQDFQEFMTEYCWGAVWG
ncbi:MAG: 4-carboxymuconolactone decarboxylase, partial [Rhodospirillaceae bacterium]|nr:4-carboxymuconolactone decarboxylase [Rhodospirillaceae bacterium]